MKAKIPVPLSLRVQPREGHVIRGNVRRIPAGATLGGWFNPAIPARVQAILSVGEVGGTGPFAAASPTPKQLRRLAVWCLRMADYLDAQDGPWREPLKNRLKGHR